MSRQVAKKAKALIEQASRLREEKRFPEAAEQLRQACALLRQYPGAGDLGGLLVDLAGCLIESRDFISARSVLAEARQVQHTRYGEESAQAAMVRRLLGKVELFEEHYEPAYQEFKGVLAILEGLTPPPDLEVAVVQTMLATVCQGLGRMVEAEALLWEAGEVFRDKLGEETEPVAQSLYYMGLIHLSAGRLVAAEHFLHKASRLMAEIHGPESIQRADCLYSLAEVYAGLQRDLKDAWSYAGAAAQIYSRLLGNQHPRAASALHLLGVILHDAGYPKEAFSNLKTAYTIFVAAYGQQHPQSVFCLFDLMTTAFKAGEIEAAEPALRWAIKTSDLGGEEVNIFLFRALIDLAGVCEAKGNVQESEELIGRAQEVIPSLGSDSDSVLRIYFEDLAQLHLRRGRPAEALPLLIRAAAVDNELISKLRLTRDDLERKIYIRRLGENTSRFLRFVLENLPADPRAVGAAFDFVLTRKGLLAESVLGQDDGKLRERQPELDPWMEQCRCLEEEIQRRQAEGATDGVTKLLLEVDRLKARLREIQAHLSAQVRPDSLPPEGWKAKISHESLVRWPSDRSALVEYFALQPARSKEEKEADQGIEAEPAPERYVAFVLRSNSPEAPCLVDLGKAEEIEKLVYSYGVALCHVDQESARDQVPYERESALVPGTEEELSEALRRSVFDPLAAALQGSKHIFIAPDGAVSRIPFPALCSPGPAPGRLIDSFTFSYLRTGRLLALPGPRPSQPAGPPLIIADPDYDLNGKSQVSQGVEDESLLRFFFPRLEGTREEARQVAARIGGRILLDQQANKQAVLGCHSPLILHLATHGYFIRRLGERRVVVFGRWRSRGYGLVFRGEVLGRAENPFLRSGLALAGANAYSENRPTPKEIGDGLLSACDVAHLHLSGTQLAVLSACSSALGDVRLGEGVAGLLHGLALAGAQSVVAALWEVPDEPCVNLMVGFYERLMAGRPRAEALREAQVALKEEDPDPWVWGSFVFYGEPGPLEQTHP